MSKLDYVSRLIDMARRISSTTRKSSITRIPIESSEYIPIDAEYYDTESMGKYSKIKIPTPQSILNAIESGKSLHYIIDDEEQSVSVKNDMECFAFVTRAGDAEGTHKTVVAVTMSATPGISYEITEEEYQELEESINEPDPSNPLSIIEIE